MYQQCTLVAAPCTSTHTSRSGLTSHPDITPQPWLQWGQHKRLKRPLVRYNWTYGHHQVSTIHPRPVVNPSSWVLLSALDSADCMCFHLHHCMPCFHRCTKARCHHTAPMGQAGRQYGGPNSAVQFQVRRARQLGPVDGRCALLQQQFS
jgi:hypothetical protein